MHSIRYPFALILVALFPSLLPAQVPIRLSPKALLQIQIPEPSVDISSPVTATAVFDPPLTRVGEPVFYRVSIDAAEASIQWPGTIPAPAELKFGSKDSGQLTQDYLHNFRPLTCYLYRVRATATGHFTVPEFVIKVRAQSVIIPAASVEVDRQVPGRPAQQLALEVSDTNVYVGQPLRARVLLPASPSNTIQALQQIQLNGQGFMSDRTTMRQAVEMTRYAHRIRAAYVYEITLTPIMTGTLKLSAQAFTAGREFTGPITISAHVVIPGQAPQYVFLVSEPIQIHVHPLPTAGQLQGFTGSMGRFMRGPLQLSTNQLRVDDPVRLTVTIRSQGGLNHLVPPALPLVKDWDIIPDTRSGSSSFSYTLIPLTDQARETPTIPFSAFDPATGHYVDLTIPSLPVTVTQPGLPTELPAMDRANVPGPIPQLSSLSATPGDLTGSLVPPQLRGWPVFFQMIPVLGILGLWQWDRRRRYLEGHPEIVRRRKARRALRREQRRLRQAARRGDRAAFVGHAADAMKIACAPHFPAHPQALVCDNILERLSETDRGSSAGQTVRRIFAAANERFSPAPRMQPDLFRLQSEVDAVLLKLEGQL